MECNGIRAFVASVFSYSALLNVGYLAGEAINAAFLYGTGLTLSAIIADSIYNITPPDNAYDPNGPKAPGKPGEAEGYRDPRGSPNWVPNPNPGSGGSSHGWEDDKGRVWCPTGQGGRAHGSPHWDVQKPGGGYDNIFPGGLTRPGR